ncbi:1172_t:CDS:1 [Funneliformis caledonium]|uniref:1172_t:CDS:1 n=1 Tax=Funneliformis caledonium TaxID=1117310 RepID=A0A9N9DQA9_9GLOM|nr:1172_t:CDS:1 [Funneliformis caledonium]
MSQIFLSLNNDNVFSGIIPNETYWYNDIRNFQPRRLDTTYLEWAVLFLGWYIILSAVPNLWIDYDLWNAFVNRDTTSRPLKVTKEEQREARDITSFPYQPTIPHKEVSGTSSQRMVCIDKTFGKEKRIESFNNKVLAKNKQSSPANQLVNTLQHQKGKEMDGSEHLSTCSTALKKKEITQPQAASPLLDMKFERINKYHPRNQQQVKGKGRRQSIARVVLKGNKISISEKISLKNN